MPSKVLLRLGLVFFLLAGAAYYLAGRSLDSRIFTPLDYPVSLESRQFKPPAFQINLKETYFASLELDYSLEDWYQDNRCNFKTILYPQWRVYRLAGGSAEQRELWVSSEQLVGESGFRSNAFAASPGRYQLEWDNPVAAPCLNARHPRLLVFTGAAAYAERIGVFRLCSVFLGGCGLALIAIGIVRRDSGAVAKATALRIFPDMPLRNVARIGKHAPFRRIEGLPHWGLLGASVLWILILVFMIFGPRAPWGIFVPFGGPKVIAGQNSPWPEAVSVYLAPPGRFFVNGEEVGRNDLRNKVLERRAIPWTIYF